MTLRIVARGTWVHGGLVETPADIVALDYDWAYEFDRAEGRLEPDQVPTPLGADGVLYYGRFKHALNPTEPTWPDTPGYRTVEEAMRYAESKVEGGIRWSARPA
jgi:hypothetical protein